jgi:hypothetical protein
MTTDDTPVARGRPPGPSLAGEAVAILERNAFAAMRGPNSRGAVPRSAFGYVDVSTVDRSVKRAFPGEKGRTPFDLATRQVCSMDAGTATTLQAVFEAVQQSFRDADEIGETLRVFLRANFEEACNEEGLLATLIVQTAACAYVESQPVEPVPADESDQLRAAREVIAMRRDLSAQMIDSYTAGLTTALRRLRRRPKSDSTMQRIVLAVMANIDGFLLFHKLQPDLVDADLVVETQWSIIWGLTEPGLLDPPDRFDLSERALVEAALAVFAEDRKPELEELARECGVSTEVARELFPDDDVLAQRCMDYAVGSSVETEAIAVNVRGAELAAIRDLLIATTKQASSTPLLVELLRHNPDGGFVAEARRHIAEALSQSDATSLDRTTADGVALMLVDAALQGSGGQSVWESGLNAFAARG